MHTERSSTANYANAVFIPNQSNPRRECVWDKQYPQREAMFFSIFKTVDHRYSLKIQSAKYELVNQSHERLPPLFSTRASVKQQIIRSYPLWDFPRGSIYILSHTQSLFAFSITFSLQFVESHSFLSHTCISLVLHLMHTSTHKNRTRDL